MFFIICNSISNSKELFSPQAEECRNQSIILILTISKQDLFKLKFNNSGRIKNTPRSLKT